MISWLTENPWPLILLLALAAGVMLAFWTSQKRGIWVLGAVAALACAVAVYFVEKAFVTEAERVENKVHAVAEAFTRQDREGTLAFFSVQNAPLRETVVQALDWVELPNGVDIKDMSVRLSNENTRAVARFRANGTVSYKQQGAQHYPSRWEVTWQKEAGDWKIIAVDRMHTIRDEKVGIFDSRQ
jgi:hypothetical protein